MSSVTVTKAFASPSSPVSSNPRTGSVSTSVFGSSVGPPSHPIATATISGGETNVPRPSLPGSLRVDRQPFGEVLPLLVHVPIIGEVKMHLLDRGRRGRSVWPDQRLLTAGPVVHRVHARCQRGSAGIRAHEGRRGSPPLRLTHADLADSCAGERGFNDPVLVCVHEHVPHVREPEITGSRLTDLIQPRPLCVRRPGHDLPRCLVPGVLHER